MMVGESGQKKTGIYRYYKCASAKRHECKLKPIRKELIEDFVVRKAMESISDAETMDRIVKQIMALLDEENVIIPGLERQLADVRKSMENIMKAIEMGVCTRTTKARLEELETEEDKLKADIQREKLSQPNITEEQIRFLLSKYQTLDTKITDNREKIIDGLIGSTVIFEDGRVIITFNYRDEPVTSTIDEIIAAANSSSDIDCIGS